MASLPAISTPAHLLSSIGVDRARREDYIPARRRGQLALPFADDTDRLLDLRRVRRIPKQVSPVPCLSQGVGWFVRSFKLFIG
jgi:hypothetical protein